MRNRTKRVGLRLQIPNRRAGDMKLGTVAISKGLAGDHGDLIRRLDLAHAPQCLTQNRPLGFDLQLIAGVLIMASATAAEVGAGGSTRPSAGASTSRSAVRTRPLFSDLRSTSTRSPGST